MDPGALALMYGTAWKEDATERLVTAALDAGFRAIDTANQRKHYYEAGVGRALATWLAAGHARAELFVQSKFTYRDGQDERLPYDPAAPIAEQVMQSFESSLEHLGLDRIDSLVLHGPSQRDGLGRADRDAWAAMEQLALAKRVGVIGISNATAEQLDQLATVSRVPIAFAQNRCYADRGWDRAARAACVRHGIRYQGFSLLTANRPALTGVVVRDIAALHRATPAQIIFAFARGLGMLPLTGTSDPQHMAQDLAATAIELDRDELAAIERAAS